MLSFVSSERLSGSEAHLRPQSRFGDTNNGYYDEQISNLTPKYTLGYPFSLHIHFLNSLAVTSFLYDLLKVFDSVL